jgi:hypothetical protein
VSRNVKMMLIVGAVVALVWMQHGTTGYSAAQIRASQANNINT